MFADLNLIHNPKDPHKTQLLVQKAIDLGYDAVAINTDIGELSDQTLSSDTTTEPPKKKKKKQSARMKTIPEPYTVDSSKLDLSVSDAKGRRFRQYTRITATITESSLTHSFLNNVTVGKYDLVAIRPADEDIMTSLAKKGATGDAPFDLFTFDATEKVYWLTRFKLIRMAIDKGIAVELSYSPALADSSARRQVLSNGRTLLTSVPRSMEGMLFYQ